MKQRVSLKVNGEDRDILIEPWQTLLSVLRDNLDLTGAKNPCGVGECAACTVLVDDRPVNSCLMLAADAAGKKITTIEGLVEGDRLSALQEAFVSHGAIQCGFCTPGMILSAKALLDSNPHPDVPAIEEALSGNFCRCTGYGKIVRAIESAARAGAKR